MEKIVNPDDIKNFIKSRDEFLNVISEVNCKTCNDPRKKEFNIDHENPLNCECRCERVEKLLAISYDLDRTIKSFTN